jgi:hypothetical protein
MWCVTGVQSLHPALELWQTSLLKQMLNIMELFVSHAVYNHQTQKGVTGLIRQDP